MQSTFSYSVGKRVMPRTVATAQAAVVGHVTPRNESSDSPVNMLIFLTEEFPIVEISLLLFACEQNKLVQNQVVAVM